MITNKVTAFIIIGNNRNGELEVTYGKGIYNIRNFYYFSTGYLVQFSNKIEQNQDRDKKEINKNGNENCHSVKLRVNWTWEEDEDDLTSFFQR